MRKHHDPSDIIDQQSSLTEPRIPNYPDGRPRKADTRDVIDILQTGCQLTLSLTNFTEPSPKRTFTPPGCLLQDDIMACSMGTSEMFVPASQSQPRHFGGATWLERVATYQANPQPSENWGPKPELGAERPLWEKIEVLGGDWQAVIRPLAS